MKKLYSSKMVNTTLERMDSEIQTRAVNEVLQDPEVKDIAQHYINLLKGKLKVDLKKHLKEMK